MRRITLWFVSTVAVLVLLFSYRTSTGVGASNRVDPIAGPAAPGIVATSTPGPDPTSGTPRAGDPTSKQAAAGQPIVVNGTVVQTRWGPVQVQVRIENSAITEVTVLVYPSGSGRDEEINSYALPRLREQTLRAQSADISGVSGATVTSDGYRQSLQAALDAAHFSG
jgi:uncharacterized protein with FMN-binding domain